MWTQPVSTICTFKIKVSPKANCSDTGSLYHPHNHSVRIRTTTTRLRDIIYIGFLAGENSYQRRGRRRGTAPCPEGRRCWWRRSTARTCWPPCGRRSSGWRRRRPWEGTASLASRGWNRTSAKSNNGHTCAILLLFTVYSLFTVVIHYWFTIHSLFWTECIAIH